MSVLGGLMAFVFFAMLGGFICLSMWLWGVHSLLALVALAAIGIPGILFYFVFVARFVILEWRSLRGVLRRWLRKGVES